MRCLTLMHLAVKTQDKPDSIVCHVLGHPEDGEICAIKRSCCVLYGLKIENTALLSTYNLPNGLKSRYFSVIMSFSTSCTVGLIIVFASIYVENLEQWYLHKYSYWSING